jgi:hypothetical protein
MEELFNLIKEYGIMVRSTKLDGLESWKKIKLLLQDKENNSCNWNISKKNLDTMYLHVHNTLNMKGEEDDPGFENKSENHKNWEKSHFFLQLVRIPKISKCELVRVCQIAYNLGQLKAERDDPIYTPEIKDYFENNRLGNLDTYIDIDCFNNLYTAELERIIISVKLLKEQIGGNNLYYKKYIKYKTKYLNLQ